MDTHPTFKPTPKRKKQHTGGFPVVAAYCTEFIPPKQGAIQRKKWLWLKIQELGLRGFSLLFHLARCHFGTFL